MTQNNPFDSNQDAGQNLNIDSTSISDGQIGIAGGDSIQIKDLVINSNIYDSPNIITLILEQVLRRSTKKHTHKDYRLLQSLLKNVKEIWIQDGLEACVFSKILMDLNISQKPNLIKKPFNESTLIIDRSRTDLKEENLTSGFLQRVINNSKSILVTGEPGSGKTTTLLKLLEKLIKKTEQDLNNPIPIVFNLSSWSISRKSISDWLVQELHEKYRVSKSLGNNLVQSENLLLLLDGLDEILSKSDRENCIHQINYFLRNYGQTQIVVCCRTKDYEELSTRLELQAAICINPLTYEQINQHLDTAGVELSGLKELLTQNASLMDLASTPLILSVMSLSYQNIGVGEIQIPSIDKYRQYLFDLYIDKMLERRALILKKMGFQSTSVIQLKYWLSWLAYKMQQQSESIFQIEELQPFWIENLNQRFLYATSMGICSGLIAGAIAGLFFLDGGWIAVLLSLLTATVSGGLLTTVFFGFIAPKIQPSETLKWSIKSISKYSWLTLLYGLVCGLCTGLSHEFINWVAYGVPFSIVSGLQVGFAYGSALGLAFMGLQALRGPTIESKIYPNQGIFQAFGNSLIFLTGTFIVILPILLISGMAVYKALAGVLFIGMILGMSGSGASAYQHFFLRLTLYLNGYIPWNYARFLEYASALIFLKRVGGGYIFVHRLLLEHFAEIYKEYYNR
jgi:hypothetical protein